MTTVEVVDVGVGGTWAARREHPRLLLGRGEYVGDVRRPGQLALVVVRSSLAHGTVRRVTVDEARRQPGVHAVLTAADLAEVPLLPLRTANHPDYLPFREPVLASDRVRYVGQPVAVVVAETVHQAEDAAELVDVDVEPDAVTVEAWHAADHEVASTIRADDGDVDAVFARADVVAEVDVCVGRDTGMPMETRGLVAEWSGDGRLHLWGPTKIVHFVRRSVAAFFALPAESVVCHRVDVGGMFGPRGELYPEDFLVPWAASVVGRPVGWVEDRREHFLSINHSREQRHVVELAATADGRLLGMRARIWVDLGAYARPIAWRVPEGTVEHLPGPYRWDALSIRCQAVCTHKTPAGTMRGPTSYETAFARERALDVLAERLGVDPVALRARNLVPVDAMPYEQRLGAELHPAVYDSGDYHAVLDGLAGEVRLDEMRADVARRRAAGELVGVGVACFLGHSGLGPEERVSVELTGHGTFVVTTAATEIGQGLESMVARVVESELGVDAASVEVRSGGSAGEGLGTFSSRTTMQLGGAVADACDRLRELADGSPGRGWADLGPVTVEGRHRMDQPTYGFGVHLALVSVDGDTGEPTVERMAVAFDCGRVIDPASARGQLEGAAVQGLGGALYAELPFDDEGQPQVTTFMDYLMPTVTETPPIDVLLYEHPGVTGNRLGAKGVGEAGVIGVGAAVAGAVSAAVGSAGAIRALPVKAETVTAHLPPWPPEPPRTSSRTVRRVLAGAGVGLAVVVAVRALRRLRMSRAR